MEPKVRDSLRQLIVRYGHVLCDDPPRCEAMLRDLCGPYKREVNCLIIALKQRIAADLLAGSAGLPAPLLLDRLSKRLEDELGLMTETAHWAVETWALALGVIAEPSALGPSSAAPPGAQPNVIVATPHPVGPPSGSARPPFEPETIIIRAGRFLMGSPASEPERDEDEGPPHWVQFPSFALGKHAVTFAEWDACVAAGGCIHTPSDAGWGRDRRPVINVCWGDAQAYVQWLSRETGKPYRLPSEAEWEYAARAGTVTPFSTGPCINTGQANYNGDYNQCGAKTGVYLGKTQPVGSYPANPWGLYDMHGNVWEWVADCWNDSYAGAPTDESAWQRENCARRAARGPRWWCLESQPEVPAFRQPRLARHRQPPQQPWFPRGQDDWPVTRVFFHSRVRGID